MGLKDFINRHGFLLAIILITLVFLIWWWPFFSKGYLPLSEWGGGLIWGDWLSDRLWLVSHKVIPEWNPSNVLGVNYIGRDPFNNPLSLGNLFKFLIPGPKTEWVFGIFLYLSILGLGTYRFLISQNISKKLALLGAVLITIYPKWIDDIYHGPGKFVTAYCAVPWIMYLIYKMFLDKPRSLHYLYLGILASIIFLSGGAWVSLLLTYLIMPWFIYNFIRYVTRSREGHASFVIMKNIGLSIFSFLVALGLSAYLLFPLLDNIRLSARSLYSSPAGYGLIDIVGLFFPWVTQLYTPGIYDFPVYLPKIGVISNMRSYFGILFLPLLVYVLMNREARKKFAFFWVWPGVVFLLFSQLGNAFFPIARLFEKALNAQSSEGFLFFEFIFCANLIIVAGLDALYKSREDFKKGVKGRGLLPGPVRRLSTALIVIYAVAAMGWITISVLLRHYPEIFNKMLHLNILNLSYFKNVNKLITLSGIQLVAYSYFLDKFFYLFLISFIIRVAILWWFRSGLLFKKALGISILGALMVFDFILIPKVMNPFTPRTDVSYSGELEQNRFIVNNVKTTERIGSFYPGEKYIYKLKRFTKLLEERYGKDSMPWAPADIYELFKNSNPDKDYFEPLFDPATTYYPVTIGKQSYNYHESLLPEYFFDFDRSMNENNKRYYRGSWNSVWDPASPLLSIAGISYIFWYEPIKADNLELAAQYPYGDGYIYRNKNALPKAYLVSKLEYFSNRADLLNRMKEGSFNPSRSATTEDREAYDIYSSGKGFGPGDVSILKYTPNRIALNVKSDQPSILIVTDLFFPYWSATIEGEPARIFRVNCVFRGMFIEKGDHVVEMRYRNPYFHAGLGISLGTLIFIIIFLGVNFIYCKRQKAFL